MPQDVTVDENNDVVFICQAKGDPEPTIIWKKEEGQIPQGRLVNKAITINNSCLNKKQLTSSSLHNYTYQGFYNQTNCWYIQ